jgi:hypothetical protein
VAVPANNSNKPERNIIQSYNDHILDKLVLARSEKQKAVIELPNQGKTVRQIAQFVHVSFGDICFIIRRETGEDEELNRIRMSKASQALRLLEQGYHHDRKLCIKLKKRVSCLLPIPPFFVLCLLPLTRLPDCFEPILVSLDCGNQSK